MRSVLSISAFLLLAGCNNPQPEKNTVVRPDTTIPQIIPDHKEKPEIRYSDRQLECFLDSVGRLNTAQLAEKVNFDADFIFRNQQQMDKLLPEADFLALKKVLQTNDPNYRQMDLRTVRKIFGEVKIESYYLTTGEVPLTLFSFDRNEMDLHEYAICVGNPGADWHCFLYFFKDNRVVAKHRIEHHYGLEIDHYKDRDGKTVVYYKENFVSGSGVWQFNFYFYKYDNNKLIPVLNELENGNLQQSCGPRIYWLEAFVLKTDPLTLKMVFYQELYDPHGSVNRIINDSTIVVYSWDERSKSLSGNYKKAGISKAQILTYYLADNQLLFINAYCKTLKATLKKKKTRRVTLNYLNKVKNQVMNN